MNLDIIGVVLKVVCLAASVTAVLLARSARRGYQKARKAIEQAEKIRTWQQRLDEMDRMNRQYKDGK